LKLFVGMASGASSTPKTLQLPFWWYYCDPAGIQSDDFVSAIILREKFARGELDDTCLVWSHGMSEWEPITSAFDAALFTFLKAVPMQPSSAHSETDRRSPRSSPDSQASASGAGKGKKPAASLKIADDDDDDDDNKGFTLGQEALEVI
jgi:hypothetical protein